MSGAYGGYFKCRTAWNAIGTVAQVLLRTAPFMRAIETPPIGVENAILLDIFRDLHCQLEASEPHLTVDPLIHNFLSHRSPDDAVDLLDYLKVLLYELDAIYSASIDAAFDRAMISEKDNTKFPILEFEGSDSLQSGFDGFTQRSTSLRLSDVLFIKGRNCHADPELNFRTLSKKYFLYAVVTEIQPGKYKLFLRDRQGWLSILNEEIQEAELPTDDHHHCLLAYISYLHHVESFRYPLAKRHSPKQSVPMIARICEFDPKSMLFIEKIERAFPTAEECHSFILSEQGKLNESLQTAFFGVDDSPATADSPPEKTAFRQRLIMYIDQHSCRLARAALRTKPIVVSLECFPVSQFHFSVQFHQSHTIRDVVDFLQRVLQEILNLTLKREIRIFQKESLRQLESHTVLSNIINTGNAFLFTIDDQGPQTTIPLKGAPLSPRQQAEYILVLPGQTFKEEKRRITVTATSTAGEMIEDAANYLRCDVATLRMCVVSEDKYSLVDINPKILIKEIKAPVRICPQFDRAVTIAIVTNPPKYVPTGTVFQLPGAVGKTSELIKGSVAKYYGQQIRTVGVRKNGKLNWSMTAMATEPHAACVAVVGSGLPPTGSGS